MDYSEKADVQEVHAAVQREKREPRVGREPLSIWLIAVYGLAIFWRRLSRPLLGKFQQWRLDPMGRRHAPMKKVTADRGRRASRTFAA